MKFRNVFLIPMQLKKSPKQFTLSKSFKIRIYQSYWARNTKKRSFINAQKTFILALGFNKLQAISGWCLLVS